MCGRRGGFFGVTTVDVVRSEAVVLVHGWGGSFRRTWQEPGWDALLADAGRKAIGVDLLGHGSAPKPHDPSAYVDLGARVLSELPDEPVDVVAFSLGARTMLGLAAVAPERFGRIVTGGVGANLLREDAEVHRRIVDGVAGTGDPDDIMGALFAQYAQQPGNDRDALLACLRAPHGRLTADDLAHITCPVLVCIGDHDFAGPGDPLVEVLPNATLQVLKNVDHFATPGAFAFIDAALEFLDAIPT
jgi:pimeloyl-ACP methyl ester carboxylesterase